MKQSVYALPVRAGLIIALAAGLCGCESFVRKFRRQKPQDDRKTQEVIVSPEEYAAATLSSGERYAQHYLLARAWLDELVDSLHEGGSRKQQLDALKEAALNLEEMQGLLERTKAAALADRLEKLKTLKDAVGRDEYSLKTAQNRQEAELLRNRIIREFSPGAVKGSLQ